MENDLPSRLPRLRIAAAVLACLPVVAFAALAQTPGTPGPGEKVTVYPGPADPCPIPDVLAESEFAITCRSGTADLLARLRRPDACGKEASNPRHDACAVLIYVIDDYDNAKEYSLPPTWTIRIGKVSRSEKIEETAITVFGAKGFEENLGPERIYELLAPIRLASRIAEYRLPGGMAPARRPNQSVNFLDKDIRYYPALLVGRGRASEVMTAEAINKHFESHCLLYQFTC